MLKKITDYIFYKDERFYASFPSITRLENNKLLLVFDVPEMFGACSMMMVKISQKLKN